MSARKNTDHWMPYGIHFYLVFIWYIIIWHIPKPIICREQSFSNPLCPYVPKDINIKVFTSLSSVKVWHNFNVNPLLSCKIRASLILWRTGNSHFLISSLLFLFHIEYSIHSYSYVLQWPASLHFQRPSGKGSRKAVSGCVVPNFHHPVK